MKCPKCNKEMKKGAIRISNGGRLFASTFVNWFPEEKDSIKPVGLNLTAEGYYCDECMEAIGYFEQR